MTHAASAFSLPVGPAPIQARYLLLQGSTPVFVDKEGTRYLDKLWAIDARAHAEYLAHFSIASPIVALKTASSSMTAIDGDPQLSAITFVAMPDSRSRLAALARLPQTFAKLWKAVGQADVVHVGIAGWPFPLGWLGAPIARMRGRRLIVVVESAPWRSASGTRASLSQRIQGWVYETLGRAVVRHADLSFFTTDQYRQSLGKANGATEHVIEATWIPHDQIIDDADLDARRAVREASGDSVLRMAFFGRLTHEKGASFLVRAIGDLPPDLPLMLDVYGEGVELDELQKQLAANPRLASVRLRGMVAYGDELFQRLRNYDVVVVPNFGDEQPRIVYDAFSQGVPVLAAATTGLRQCVTEGDTGFFFEVGDATDLQRLLMKMCEPAMEESRRKMVARCVEVARSMTHAGMHRKRAALIGEFLEK